MTNFFYLNYLVATANGNGVGTYGNHPAIDMVNNGHNLATVGGLGTVLALSREDIGQIILRKEGVLAEFLGDPGCQPWPVIYTLDDRASGSADLAPEAAASSYSSRFQKVFVLDAARKGLVELNKVPAR